MQNIIANKEELREVMQEVVKDEIIEGFCNQFKNIFLSPEDVAKIHGVNRLTVINHIKDGSIEAEPREKQYDCYKIRMSYALTLDFSQLRKKIKLRATKR